jgi:hypothetical protein
VAIKAAVAAAMAPVLAPLYVADPPLQAFVTGCWQSRLVRCFVFFFEVFFSFKNIKTLKNTEMYITWSIERGREIE